jgi:hypothetical protein
MTANVVREFVHGASFVCCSNGIASCRSRSLREITSSSERRCPMMHEILARDAANNGHRGGAEANRRQRQAGSEAHAQAARAVTRHE